MTVDRTTVQVEVEGEQKAAADARRLELIAERIRAKAQQAKAEVKEADLESRKLNLFQRALRKGKGELGPVEIGPNGFAVNRGWMSGRGAGAVSGPLLATYAVSRGADAISNVGNTVADLMQDGETFAQVLKRAPARIARKIGEFATAPSVKLGGMITRFSAGYTAEQADLAMDEVVTDAFGQGPSQLDAMLDAQKLAHREHRRAMAERERKNRRDDSKKRESIEAALEKNDEATAARIRGLRAPVLPVRVPDDLWRDMKWVAEERERRRGNLLKQRLSAGAGS